MSYRLDAVGKRYPARRGDVVSLDAVTTAIATGERVAVIGASGAGKSTLLRLLNGTLRPSSGRLRFHDRDVATLSAREARAMRRRIGTIYQQAPLVPSLTALDNTLCGALGAWSLWHSLRAAIAPPRADRERALAALAQVGLADKRDARADELSGGQQQRVAIARLIMQDPEVILADEPFSALDPALTDSVARLLLDLAAAGRSLVCTLHDVELALRLFPRVLALRDGTLAFDAASADVTRDMLDALYRGAPAAPQRAEAPLAARGPHAP
ncbi:MAG TPA: ATP-binding cassette domain-containing protein, partial [Kofleriaceae bacterium]|nr:ATP-binding cassette domain-containing protein [Kofleriaceae bacterium]